MSATSSFKDKAIKAGVTGLIGATAGYILGERGTTTVSNMQVPTTALIAVGTGVSSIAADYAGEKIYPDTTENQRLMHITSGALGLGVSGATTSLILNRGFGPNSMNSFLLGAGSYAAGDWVTNIFVNPPEVVRY